MAIRMLKWVAGAWLVSAGLGSWALAQETEFPAKWKEQVVATMAGRQITRYAFEVAYRTLAEAEMRFGEEAYFWHRALGSQADFIIMELLCEDATRRGLAVSDAELNRHIEESVDSRLAGASPKEIQDLMVRSGVTTVQELRRLIISDLNREQWRRELLLKKLREAVESEAARPPTDEQLLQEFDEVRARHIFVSSITRAQPEAKALAEKVLAELKAGSDFGTLAVRYSEDPLTNGELVQGELGWFDRHRMIPEFTDVAFALPPGQLSDVVETPLGFHIIQVEEKRRRVPVDFAERKDQYRTLLLAKRRTVAWDEYERGVRKRNPMTVLHPGVLGYSLLLEGKADEAVAQFLKALESPGRDGIFLHYCLGRAYLALNRPDDAYRELKIAMDDYPTAPEIHVALGRAYLAQSKVQEALAAFAKASELAINAAEIHAELEQIYRGLGRDDLADQEAAWPFPLKRPPRPQ